MRHLFSAFDVSRQVFHTTRLSLAIVNLKPLLPGHVLVLPKRVVPRITDLDADEVSDLFLAVQSVGKAVEKAYGAEALTVSVQDGAAAGQSVPHVHVHVLPRFRTDFGGKNDDIYPKLEQSEHELRGDLAVSTAASGPTQSAGAPSGTEGARVGRDWDVPADDDRKPRSVEEMEREAQWLAGYL